MPDQNNKKVVIMYLLWSHEPRLYLPDAIQGVLAQDYNKENLEFLLIYNSHKPDEPSQAPYIRETLAQYEKQLPHTTFLDQPINLGFSGANNLGMQWAIDHQYDFIFLHNGDGYMDKSCVSALVHTFAADARIGAAQSLVALSPETHLINTAGNLYHYLGLGYCNEYRTERSAIHLPDIGDIGYASGAAIMMRTDLLKQFGLWDKDYFMYHEDTDYSFRLKLLGFRVVLASQSVFFHKYNFSKSIEKYFWMERNRYAILLLFFRWPTLLLLSPMLLFLECGFLFFAWKGGWGDKKIAVYRYWFNRKNLRLWLEKRKELQKKRVISDRELLRGAVSQIHFQEAAVDSPLVHYVANPITSLYFWIIIKPFLRW